MKQRKPFPDPAEAHALLDEADIGSGEKTAGERDTDEMVDGIGSPQDEIYDEAAESTDPSGDDTGSGVAGEREFDASGAHQRLEHDASLIRDDAQDPLNDIDPVPPRGQ